MSAERILPVRGCTSGYFAHQYENKRRKAFKSKPIEAVTFDVVDLSGNVPNQLQNYEWLIALTSQIPDEVVSQKISSTFNSFIDIDGAVAEKLMFEEI